MSKRPFLQFGAMLILMSLGLILVSLKFDNIHLLVVSMRDVLIGIGFILISGHLYSLEENTFLPIGATLLIMGLGLVLLSWELKDLALLSISIRDVLIGIGFIFLSR